MKKVTVLILMVLSLSITSFAGDKQLSLDRSSIEDGESNVSINPEFNLLFTNNVINASVRDINMSAISLTDADGKAVDIIVTMADDQINPEEKRKIKVNVSSELAKGSDYKLLIDGSFSGKNGSTIGEDIIINFTTKGGKNSNVFLIALGGMILIIIAFLAYKKKSNANA